MYIYIGFQLLFIHNEIIKIKIYFIENVTTPI